MKKRRRRKAPRNILYVTQTQKPIWQLPRRRLMQIGGWGLLAVASCLGLYLLGLTLLEKAFFDNDTFRLNNLHVEVQGQVSTQEVLRVAAIAKGDPLMRMNLHEIRNRISQMPYVAEVRVQRRLPDTIWIQVEERQPVARIIPKPRSGERIAPTVYYTDARGFIMRPRPGERLKALPIITGIRDESVIEGSQTLDMNLLSAVALLTQAERSHLKGRLDLSQIEIRDQGQMLMRTQGKGLVRFASDHVPAQMERLRMILKYAEDSGRNVRTVDLTPERNVPVTFYN